MNTKSIEPQVADFYHQQMKKFNLDYKLEQESLNYQIDKALQEYASKTGGSGGNRPDAKLLLTDKYGNYYPVVIEFKGYKDALVKLDAEGIIENKTGKNESNYANIKTYAVNGAVHYANAILHYTNYDKIISIGITGYIDTTDKMHTEIGVYYVSPDNLALGQSVGEYNDLSFLKKENFDDFIQKCKDLHLSDSEKELRKTKRDAEIYKALKDLNNEIYKNNDNSNLGEQARLYLVVASIMASLGIPNTENEKDRVAPLTKDDLTSKSEKGFRDGDIMLGKIKNFLDSRERKIPEGKRELIVNTLRNTLLDEGLNKVVDGETQLKRIFCKIIDDIGIYYKIGLTTDFTGMLFNEMYRWLGFSQDQLNDVVLTPSYVSKLLVKLARVNKDSYVWDFAMGSGGLLIAAMNEMLDDADRNLPIGSDELNKKKLNIKLNQILGVEILPEIYMLAVLNMIMMGDGSSNLLNDDSLKNFNGEYSFRKPGEKFPATAFVLNPPYSADGRGMIFVAKALSMMDKGYAAIIIKSTAGSGQSIEYNKGILKRNTLLASIKMPPDLFLGKSTVQTHIYAFKVGEEHTKNDYVKFIDFTDDGYTRTARKKSSVNLRDTGYAKEKYDELVRLVTSENFNLDDLVYLKDKVYLSKIDVKNGADWNQSKPTDKIPPYEDFQKTVKDYLSWRVGEVIKNGDDGLGK